MIFTKPSVIPIEGVGLQEKIEQAYRVCYKSEKFIKEGSAELISRLLHHGDRYKRKHTSPLSHARITLKVDWYIKDKLNRIVRTHKTLWNTAPHMTWTDFGSWNLLTTNFRVLFEILEAYSTQDNEGNACLDSPHLMVMADVLHEAYPYVFRKYKENYGLVNYAKDIPVNPVIIVGEDKNYVTFRIITTRDILQEIARHATLDPSVESTRYCDYTKKGICFTLPEPYDFMDEVPLDDIKDTNYQELSALEQERIKSMDSIEGLKTLDNFKDIYLQMCRITEILYTRSRELGILPQQARMLLPGGLKTEMIISGTLNAWDNFISLRDAPDAQCQIQIIAEWIRTYLEDKFHYSSIYKDPL